jgi:predicted flap endonuclease-1-like 5' DNA nuclease
MGISIASLHLCQIREEKAMSYKIETIEGIGKVMGDKLRANGVADTAGLLAKAATPKDQATLVAQTGISGKLILKFASRADLMRVNGVCEEYADLLEAAGVDTVSELAQRKAQNPCDALTRTNAEKKLVVRSPLSVPDSSDRTSGSASKPRNSSIWE